MKRKWKKGKGGRRGFQCMDVRVGETEAREKIMIVKGKRGSN